MTTSVRSSIYLGRGLQSIFIVRYFLKLRAEILAYQNGHSEITDIKTISLGGNMGRGGRKLGKGSWTGGEKNEIM